MSHRVIAFSLYGTDPLYVRGAAENIDVAPKVYPGWIVRFYGPKESHAALEAEHPLGPYEWIDRPTPMLHEAMFWRFDSAADPNASHILFRDADSRLNPREAAATEAWIKSGKDFCILRDHPDHANWPILGGMWGIRGGLLPNIGVMISKWMQGKNNNHEKLADMRWLAEVIWPMAQFSMKHYSSVRTPHPLAEPFPHHELFIGHCGEIVPVGVNLDVA